MAGKRFGESKTDKTEAPAAAPSGPVLPDGYEWYTEGVFPATMVIDKTEPKRIWNGKFWAVAGKISPLPLGHAAIGRPNTPYVGYVFVWNPDGTHGGRWAKPVKKVRGSP